MTASRPVIVRVGGSKELINRALQPLSFMFRTGSVGRFVREPWQQGDVTLSMM
jgi:hypothetical protein